MRPRIEQEIVQQSDGAITRTSTVYESGSTVFFMHVDSGFVETGIEANGLLIDQARTKQRWGRTPGHTPEEFLTKFEPGSIAICPSNWGWQYGSFMVKYRRLLHDPNDPTLTGDFTLIGYRNGKWGVETISLSNSEEVLAEKSVLRGMEIGFSMPLIVRDGKVADPTTYITDFRLMADLRNYANFAPDRQMPAEFWTLLRLVLPSTSVAAQGLVRGEVVTQSNEAMTKSEALKLQQYIREYDLGSYLKLNRNRGVSRLTVLRKLPLIRIPVIGVGVTEDHRLMVTAVDGRQSVSAGMTIEELAHYMQQRGAVHVGLGCAGGDVAVVERLSDGMKVHNVPSNSGGVTRPCPSALIMFDR